MAAEALELREARLKVKELRSVLADLYEYHCYPRRFNFHYVLSLWARVRGALD